MKSFSVAAFKLLLERWGQWDASLFSQLPFNTRAQVSMPMARGAQHRDDNHRSYSLRVARPQRTLSHPQDGPGLKGWCAHTGFSNA